MFELFGNTDSPKHQHTETLFHFQLTQSSLLDYRKSYSQLAFSTLTALYEIVCRKLGVQIKQK